MIVFSFLKTNKLRSYCNFCEYLAQSAPTVALDLDHSVSDDLRHNWKVGMQKAICFFVT